MSYSKGQSVFVRDYRGRKVALRVWKETTAAVFVTSPEVFQQLEAGETDVRPVGVPKQDVSAIRARGPR